MSLSAEHAVPLGGSGGPARHLQAGAHMRIRVGDHMYVGMVLGTTEGRTHLFRLRFRDGVVLATERGDITDDALTNSPPGPP